MPADIRRRCQAVEQCYEFTLAYAAQGLASETGNQSSTQIREVMQRAVGALSGLERQPECLDPSQGPARRSVPGERYRQAAHPVRCPAASAVAGPTMSDPVDDQQPREGP
jgi:hypothetical protein